MMNTREGIMQKGAGMRENVRMDGRADKPEGGLDATVQES